MTDPEPDISGEENCEETKPPNGDTKRRINLAYGDQTVELEGPDSLDELAKLAAYFWLLTSPPKQVTFGFTAGASLVTEIAADPDDNAAGE